MTTPHEAKITIGGDGFLHPPGDRERDFVDANGFRHLGVRGLPVSMQFVCTRVHLPPAAAPSEELVVWAHLQRVDSAVLGSSAPAIRLAFPDAAITFVVGVSLVELGGIFRAEVEALCENGSRARHAVAAVSAAQCWGNLAEIEEVTVRLGGLAYRARMQSMSGAWMATLSTRPDDAAR